MDSQRMRCDPRSVSIGRPLPGLSKARIVDLVATRDVHRSGGKVGDVSFHLDWSGMCVVLALPPNELVGSQETGRDGSGCSGMACCPAGSTLCRRLGTRFQSVDGLHRQGPHCRIPKQNPLRSSGSSQLVSRRFLSMEWGLTSRRRSKPHLISWESSSWPLSWTLDLPELCLLFPSYACPAGPSASPALRKNAVALGEKG